MTVAELAHRLGETAHAAGLPAAPLAHPALHALQYAQPDHAARMTVLRAWLVGWHSANAAHHANA